MADSIEEIDQILGTWRITEQNGDPILFQLLSGIDSHTLRLIDGNQALVGGMTFQYSRVGDTYTSRVNLDGECLAEEEFELNQEVLVKEMSGLKLWKLSCNYENNEVVVRRRPQDSGQGITSRISVQGETMTRIIESGDKKMQQTLVNINHKETPICCEEVTEKN